MVSAAVRRYTTHAHGDPVMLVHAATAPNAVLRVLPSLPNEQWAASASAAWSASAAIHALYSSPTAVPLPKAPATDADAFDRAAQHGDEHVIKLADTALDTYLWTGDELALAAVERQPFSSRTQSRRPQLRTRSSPDKSTSPGRPGSPHSALATDQRGSPSARYVQ